MADLATRIAEGIFKRPWLKSLILPMANRYASVAGYRQIGLRHDDLIEEESPTVQTALKRLSSKDSYDRIYRLRRAVQCSYQHKLLPKEDWTKPEEDVPYLTPIIEQIKAELAEEKALNSMEVIKKAKH